MIEYPYKTLRIKFIAQKILYNMKSIKKTKNKYFAGVFMKITKQVQSYNSCNLPICTY